MVDWHNLQRECGAFACSNTFEAVVFTSYSAFWISYACVLIPFFNVAAGYAKNPEEFYNAIGHYLVGNSSPPTPIFMI